MSKKAKLSRCPFCNGKPNVLKGFKGIRIVIECCDCVANIWQFEGESEENISTRWNKRLKQAEGTFK